MFEAWASIGSPFSEKGRAYLYRTFFGPENVINHFRKTMGVTVIGLVSAWKFMKKYMVIGAPFKDIGNGPEVALYEFTLQV